MQCSNKVVKSNYPVPPTTIELEGEADTGGVEWLFKEFGFGWMGGKGLKLGERLVGEISVRVTVGE